MENNTANLIELDFHSLIVVGGLDINEVRKSLGVSEADFQELSGDNIKIEQIRNLIHWLFLRPMNSLYKLAVISDADGMTIEAANSLLKTLEEPPEYAKIILVTTNEQKLLATIQSRCRKIRLPLEEIDNLPENFLSAKEMGQKSLKERFDLVNKYNELELKDQLSILTAWQNEFRLKMLAGENYLSVLKEISRAKDLLETNISVKLLLENIVLKF